MTISFKLTKKDYWNYNNFSVLRVKNIRRIFIATPILVCTLTLLAGFIFKPDKMWIIYAVAFGVPAFYILTVYFPMAKGVMRIPEEKLVEHSIEFNDDKKQIIHTIGNKRNKYSKTNVMQYKRTKNYIFITLTNYSGIIIPSSNNYNFDEIMVKLDEYFKTKK